MSRYILVVAGICLLLLPLPCVASWATLACEARQIRPGGDEEKHLLTLISGNQKIYIRGPSFLSVDIGAPEASDTITCEFRISVSQQADWLDKDYEENEAPGLALPLPHENRRSSKQLRNLPALLATIESQGLTPKYSHLKYTSADSKRIFAVRNMLSVALKTGEPDKIQKLVLTYLHTLNSRAPVYVYTGPQS